MLIVGAKGFAKEVLEIFYQLGNIDNIAFYDDINSYTPPYLFNTFSILRDTEEVLNFFRITDKKFTIGIGNPHLRLKLYHKFLQMEGEFTSSISPLASIGNYDIHLGKGSNILSNSILSNSVYVGIGCIIYYNVVITHDCKVGNFVELSPGATLLGNVEVGDFTQIGSNSTILPNIKIGNNVVIGAGSVVTRDVPDNCIVVGVPARVIKILDPFYGKL